MCWVEEEKRARGKGCVKRMKTAVCALEAGAWGAAAGGPGWRSFCQRAAPELLLGVWPCGRYRATRRGPCAEEAAGT